jgi:hypothetical protein
VTPTRVMLGPARPSGPADYRDFNLNYAPSQSARIESLWLSLLPATAGLVLSIRGGSGYVYLGCLVTWLVIGAPFFMSYAKSCLAFGGQSLVFLPWRQLWTYKFVVLTLPYAPVYYVSALRFLVWWMLLRHCRTYNTRPLVPGMNGHDLAAERRQAAMSRMRQVRQVLVGNGS